MFQKNADHHDDWEREYWAGQPEPKAGSREHLEKYGGPGWLHVAAAGVLVAMVIIVGILIGRALTLPIVYQSYSSGHCIKVDDPTGVYSCENMPVNFHHEWVE